MFDDAMDSSARCRSSRSSAAKHLTAIVLALGAAVLFQLTSAVYAGPVSISTWEELDNVRHNPGADYVLTQDLDQHTPDYHTYASEMANEGAGWEPIPWFGGHLDGDGHSIRNLLINRPEKDGVGLFAILDEDGVIIDLSLEDMDVTGEKGVGALVGYNNGRVEDCAVIGGEVRGVWIDDPLDTDNDTGVDVGGLIGKVDFGGEVIGCSAVDMDVSAARLVGGLIGWIEGGVVRSSAVTGGTVTGYLDVGGLVGTIDKGGRVDRCYSTARVIGAEEDGGGAVGGLVGVAYKFGEAYGRCVIEDSWASGDVSGYDGVGGLVGENADETIIRSSYATGHVSGNFFVGGLVGANLEDAEIKDCYSTGEVSGDRYVGGLVGMNGLKENGKVFAGVVKRSYAVGVVSGVDGPTGALVGAQGIDAADFSPANSGLVEDSFWDADMNPTLPGVGFEDTENFGAEGKTTQEMKQQATFTGAGWDFDDIWAIDEGNAYPIHQWSIMPDPIYDIGIFWLSSFQRGPGGAAVCVAHYFEIEVEAGEDVDSIRFKSPHGVWYDMEGDGEEGLWWYELMVGPDDLAQLTDMFPHGDYLVEATLTGGEVFETTAGVTLDKNPESIPSVITPGYGVSGVSGDLQVAWHEITEPDFEHLIVWIEGVDHEHEDGAWPGAGATSHTFTALSPDAVYEGGLALADIEEGSTPENVEFFVARVSESRLLFDTAGNPDFSFIESVWLRRGTSNSPEEFLFEVAFDDLDSLDIGSAALWSPERYGRDDIWERDGDRIRYEENAADELARLMDGWYALSLRFNDGTGMVTAVWFGEPDQDEFLAKPAAPPVFTAPEEGASVVSPVTLEWEEIVDDVVNQLNLMVWNITADESVLEDFLEADISQYLLEELDAADYAAYLAAARYHATDNEDDIAYEVARYRLAGRNFSVSGGITVTFSVVGENGTLTAEVDGAPIASGDMVLEGKDVVFTAAPDADYMAAEWKVNGDVVPDGNPLPDPFIGLNCTVEGIDDDINVTVEFGLIVTAWPTASAITYGQPLSESDLTGGQAGLPGEFTFDNPGDVLAAGTHEVGVTFTPDDDRYEETYAVGGTVSVTVNKKNLQVTAVADDITYGDAPPAVRVEYEGFVPGDDESDLDDTGFVLGTDYEQFNPVGTYNTTIDMGTAQAANYSFEPLSSGSFEVVKAALTITAEDRTKTYGDELVFDEVTPSDDFYVTGLLGDDRVDDVTLASAGAPTAAEVDGYEITVGDVQGAGLDNYDITYVHGTLTVGKKALEITAESFGKEYGTLYAFDGDEFSTDGLVGDDRVDDVALASDGAPAAAAVGDYAITIGEAQGAGLDNYDITYVPGILTVEKKTLTIGGEFTVLDKIFDGNAAATIDDNSLELDGVVPGDDVTLIPVTVFENAEVGVDKTVTLTGDSMLAGVHAGNYELSLDDAPTTTGTITDPANIDYIMISPVDHTATAGQTVAYTATAYDEEDEDLGDVTQAALWAIDSEAGGWWVGGAYTTEKAGSWTIKAMYATAGGDLENTTGLTVNPGPATQLAFSVQPGDSPAGVAFDPDVRVQVQDAYGNLIGGAGDSITLAVRDGDVALWGEAVVDAAAGEAAFPGVFIGIVGEGYTLEATAAGLDAAVSEPFDVTFDSGSGTELEPYGIANVHQLQSMMVEPDAHYALTDNIDASDTVNWNGAAGFEPVGDYYDWFTGSLRGEDGEGGAYTISGLTINRPGADYIGLFGYANGAFIYSLTFEEINVNGRMSVGGLTAYSDNSSIIERVHVTGNVISSNNFVGGLVGMLNNSSAIRYSSAGVNVSGRNYTGGLAGACLNNSIIEYSYSTGDVTGKDDVGGLTGYSASVVSPAHISFSHATGSVLGERRVGGLAGYIGSGISVNHCYAADEVTGTENVGGLAGSKHAGGSVNDSYWDVETTGQTLSAGSDEQLYGRTTAEMMLRATFTGWDFDDVWSIVADAGEAKVSYPFLTANVQEPAPGLADAFVVDFAVAGGENGVLSAKVGDVGIVSGTPVLAGADVDFTAEPEAGYMAAEWKLNGDLVPDGNPSPEPFIGLNYTLEGIDEDVDVSVEFGLIVAAWPTTSAITYGQPLSESVLDGDETGLAGDFTFDNPGDVLAAGTHDVGVTFTPEDVRYQDVYAIGGTVSVTVNTKELTVTGAVAQDRAYDGTTDAVVTGAQLSGVVDGDDVALENHGTGTFAQSGVGININVATAMTLGGNDAGNYTLAQPELQADIFPLQVVITPDAGQGKVYGEADPAEYTYTHTDLVSADTITGALGRVEGEDVGNYAFTTGTLTAGPNYSLVLAPEPPTFAISTLEIVITPDADQSKVYGEDDPELTCTHTDLVGTDTITGALGRMEGEDAGEYDFTLGDLTVDDNYTLVMAADPPLFAITPAPLTVTADDKFKVHGSDDPAFTVTYDGFVAGENDTVLGGELAFVRAPDGEETGEYGITPSGLTSDNYDIEFVSGVLTIVGVIQDMIDAAVDDPEIDTVVVEPGVYFGPITIPEGADGFTLRSTGGRDATFISAECKVVAITIEAENVTVEGFWIADFSEIGILILGDNARIGDNVVDGVCGFDGDGAGPEGRNGQVVKGISVGGEGARIYGCSIEDAGYGIHILETGSGARVSNNTITRCSAAGIVNEPGTSPPDALAVFNNIFGNEKGVVWDGGEALKATSNWWGDDTGPDHEDNPGAFGDGIVGNVDFDPWLGAETTGSAGVARSGEPSVDTRQGTAVETDGGEVCATGTQNTTGVAFRHSATASFTQLLILDDTDMTEVMLKIYYTEPSDKIVYWFDKTLEDWVACEPRSEPVPTDPEHEHYLEGFDGYVIVEISGDPAIKITRPQYPDDFSGVVFGIGDGAERVRRVSGSSYCFIATAAFGSADALQVQVLREFRDRYLLTNRPGRGFVTAYYRHSPRLAAAIEGRPALRMITGAALLPVSGMAYLLMHGWYALVLLVVVPGLVMILAVRNKSRLRKFDPSCC